MFLDHTVLFNLLFFSIFSDFPRIQSSNHSDFLDALRISVTVLSFFNLTA